MPYIKFIVANSLLRAYKFTLQINSNYTTSIQRYHCDKRDGREMQPAEILVSLSAEM